ncbi:MAG: nucleotidyltransferase domain-containing protein [Ginsengibacter sp.]
MIKLVENNIEEIRKVCEKMQIESLYLFGSGSIEKKFTNNSDLDFLYKFKKDDSGLSLSQYDYFDLLFDLETITGKKIDLVAEEKISNKFFLERINREKIKVYES